MKINWLLPRRRSKWPGTVLLVACALACVQSSAPVLRAQQPPPIWQSEFSQISALVNKVRAGRDLTPKRWPNGGKVAVALSFDFDTETLFLRAGQLSPQPLSRGEYGARAAMPRILQLLEKQRIPASFFIPIVSAQLHQPEIDRILQSPLTHEIALHDSAHQ